MLFLGVAAAKSFIPFSPDFYGTRLTEMERKNLLRYKGYNFKMIVERVCSVMDLEPSEIWKGGKARKR
jgi:hypothetical protein